MQAQYRPQPYARLNAFHGQKRQLLGNSAGHVPPAWRHAGPPTGPHSAVNGPARGRMPTNEAGSKIFLSRLPMDVGETEVEVPRSLRTRQCCRDAEIGFPSRSYSRRPWGRCGSRSWFTTRKGSRRGWLWWCSSGQATLSSRARNSTARSSTDVSLTRFSEQS